MTKIVDHGDWVEVINTDGERLFCHVSAEKAQATWDQEARDAGLAHLGFEKLPVEIATTKGEGNGRY